MLKLGIVGLSEGNGHPYSWAAIINGYDLRAMDSCPFPVIPQYLGARPESDFGIEDSRVSHIWTQDRETSLRVARAAKIEKVVTSLEDMIGEVDALLLARDDGQNHLAMAAPFLDKGIPVFIDKPLTDNARDLEAFRKRYAAGQPLVSTSCFRYSMELLALAEERYEYASAVSPKYWRTYGIHILEGVRAVMGGGFKAVRDVGAGDRSQVQLTWRDGRTALLEVVSGMAGPIAFNFYGPEKWVRVDSFDTFGMFKAQLEDFVGFVKSGIMPFPAEETIEMISVIVAAQASKAQGGGKWVEIRP